MLDGSLPALSLRVALVVAVVVSGIFLRARINYLGIPKLRRLAPARPSDCMVVIPARNEEQCVARAVRSFPHDTVIVVDDHSTDRTADTAREAGAGVLRAPDLPRGAVGKSNACREGARVLTSKWILFTDADAWFEPAFLESAVAHAEARDLVFLSVYPQLDGRGNLLAPFAAALYFCGIGPRGDGTASFNGQSVLVRRDAYEFVGGHGAVLSSLTEDVKLAGLALRHRLKFGVARAEDLGHVRFREPWRAVARGAFRFTMVSPWSGVAIMIATVSIALWLPVLLWMFAEGHWTAGAIFALLPAVVTAPWYRDLRIFLAPVAIYWMLPMMGNGFVAAVTGRRVKWKGRVI